MENLPGNDAYATQAARKKQSRKPMDFFAKQKGRLEESAFLSVLPDKLV
jgi:hypothetical protein